MLPAAQTHSVIGVPLAGTGVSVKSEFDAAPSSVAADVVIVITPLAMVGASAYLLATSLQPASTVAAGTVPRAATYSATCVLQAPAAARASETRERIV